MLIFVVFQFTVCGIRLCLRIKRGNNTSFTVWAALLHEHGDYTVRIWDATIHNVTPQKTKWIQNRVVDTCIYIHTYIIATYNFITS